MKWFLPLTVLAACFPTVGQPTTPPAPMTNDQALAYAHAHRDPNLGALTATNQLGREVCRVVFLMPNDHKTFVVQKGPTDPNRGNLDPTDQPLLEVGEQSIMTMPLVPDQPGARSYIITAFGCDRPDRHHGMYVVDENKVLYQQTLALSDQAKLVLAK
ncbi:MAG: hypothetical protein QM831_12685 [Kofleriaceae bacterium]